MNTVRVLVIGRGYIGATAFSYLEKCLTKVRQPVDLIYLSDRNYYFTEDYLSELLTESSDLIDVSHAIRSIGILRPGVSFVQANILDIDLSSKNVKTSKGEISYNYLLFVPESNNQKQNNLPNSFELGSPEKVLMLKSQVFKNFEIASFEKNADVKKQLMAFNVIGGGIESIEKVCAISDYSDRLLKKCFPELSSNLLKINMIVEGESILPNDNLFYSTRLLYQLKKRGINIYLNSKDIKVKNEKIEVNDENSINAGTVIFSEKNNNSSLADNLSFRKDEHDRICVDLYLKADGLNDVFVIGELSKCLDVNDENQKTNLYYKEQAKICAENIFALINGNPLKPIKPTVDLSFISLGYRNSMTLFKGFYFDGFFSWVIYRLICIWSFITWKKKIRALSSFLVNLTGLRDCQFFCLEQMTEEVKKVKK